ncbi:class I SAM-dependent methyltransferase [Nocardioides hungaricus]
MYRMFVRPQGPAGEAGARLMGRTGGPLAREAVDLLAIDGPHARVVEIGFGPGVGLAALVRRVPRGHVTGVDPSAVMHRHAARRNAEAVRQRRLTLVRAEAAHLPFADDSFDAALMIDNLHFWPDPHAGLVELRRVLVAGGRVVCAFSPPSGGPPAQVTSLFAGAGYAEITTVTNATGFLLAARAAPAAWLDLAGGIYPDG